MHRALRGNSLFGFLIAFVVGGLIGAGLACLVGWICGGHGGGGGSGGGGGTVQTLSGSQCPSAPNACGLITLGIGHYDCPSGYTCTSPGGLNGCTSGNPTNACYKLDSSGGYATNGGTCSSGGSGADDCGGSWNPTYVTEDAAGVCDADTPPNSQCPAPVIGENGFYADPSIIGGARLVNGQGQTTLHWQASNSTACSISGDNGFSASGDASGEATATGLTQTTTFTLTCQDGDGGPTGKRSIRVIVDPKYREI